LIERGELVLELEKTATDIATFVAAGELTSDELLEAHRTCVDWAPLVLALVDLSSATLARIDGEAMRQLARRAAQLGIERGVRGRVAIVCARDVDFGMARMFSTYVSLYSHPLRFEVFPGLNSARAWLAGEAEDN
jgi:hypothetical protein